MDYGSPESEGEIIESDIETTKATTARPSTINSTSVNRKLREALSPSPPRSPSGPARSPYCSQQRSPREEKRYRDTTYRVDGHRNDPRSFKVHYEGRANLKESGRRYRDSYDSPYDDLDRPQSRDSHHGYGDHRNKRHRTRSRSPQGHRRAESYQRDDHRDRRSDRYNEDHRRQEPVSSGGRSPFSFDAYQKPKTKAETRPDRLQSTNGSNSQITKSQRSSPTSEDESNKQTHQDASFHQVDKLPLKGGSPSVPTAMETLSIEERRKRREAILAKYKNQDTPLLVQALQSNSADAGTTSSNSGLTPAHDTDRAESMSAPDTPAHDSSAQGSPPSLSVADDLELANRNVTETADEERNEPSAADYDPSMDMQEDLKRTHGNQQNGNNDASGAVNVAGKTHALHDVEVTDNQEPPAKKQKKDAGDMFASDDDDDDDMFAPMPADKAVKNLSNGVQKAKELDQSLLDNWDDHEGYYKIILGELLDGRYHVQSNLGKGMFSSVVRAMDNKNSRLVAIKIIRNNETMSKAAAKEIDILELLARSDPEDKKHLIRLERSFHHKGHLCMVFENLSINLREVLKKFGRDVGINLKAVRSYAQQMFLGLSLLRKCNILHADLKPDNILVNESRNWLKVCDLGSAADASEREITPYLVSRFYRAPEIILGLVPDFSIDMWSIGCTLFELYTGKILFTGRTNNQMLRSIMECRGKFPLKMLKKAEFGAVHFDDSTNSMNFRSVERDRITGRDITRLINFVQKPTRDLKTRLLAAASSNNSSSSSLSSDSKKTVQVSEAEMKEVNLFADLLDRCLALNPEKRLTPLEALKHPFIHRSSSIPNNNHHRNHQSSLSSSITGSSFAPVASFSTASFK